MQGRLCLVLAVLAIAPAAWASKIELSTVPPREGVEVIIYRDVDLTLVREQRVIRFHEGENEVSFSWADTHIDPTSVRVRIAGDGAGYALAETTYPPEQPNTLVWTIQAPKDGPAPLEVTYFTSGLAWSASYTLILSHDETEAELAADFSIANASGETYEEARVALLTGGVRLVERIVALGGEVKERARRAPGEARAGLPAAETRDNGAPPEPSEAAPAPSYAVGRLGEIADEITIAAATVSEHERYNLDTDLALPDEWVTRLRFAASSNVHPVVLGRVNAASGGAPIRIVKLTNGEEAGLGGAPLPAGPVTLFKRAPSGRLIYIGQSALPYAGPGQEVEFAAGALTDIVVEPNVMAARKRDLAFDERNGQLVGKVTETDFTVEVRNRDAIARTLELIHMRPGAPNVFVGDAPTKREAGRVTWEFALEPGAANSLSYAFHEYYGTAVNAMPAEEGSQ